MPASTIPNRVTDDCAEAAPAAARAARATRDFFIASFSKVKHRAPVQRAHTVTGTFVLPPDPGPTSFWEVDAIAPDAMRKGKAIQPKYLWGGLFRCRGATEKRTARRHHDVKT